MGGKGSGPMMGNLQSPFQGTPFGDGLQRISDDRKALFSKALGLPQTSVPQSGVQPPATGGDQPAGGAPSQINLGSTDIADPSPGTSDTGSQTNQEPAATDQEQQAAPQSTGAAMAQSVVMPAVWQDAVKKKPTTNQGGLDISGQV